MNRSFWILIWVFIQSCISIKKQNEVIFEPVPLSHDYAYHFPPRIKERFNIEEISVETQDGIRLSGLLFQRLGKSNGLLICFPGNADNLQHWLDTNATTLDLGFDVLVTDYRGFGKSTGHPDGQRQMFSDAGTIYNYARKRGYRPDNIIVFGYSMGSAMACHLASTTQVKGLILESPYSSIAEINWVGHKAPSYPLSNKEMAKHIKVPTLIIHGDQDSVITPDHAQRIYNNLPTNQKRLVMLQGGGHGNLRSRTDYQEIIHDFLNKSGFILF